MKVSARIQKWGNGLAIRISGVMRDVPHFEEGTQLEVEVSESGLLIKKIEGDKKSKLPYTENELLANISPDTAFTDLVSKPLDSEF